MIWSTCLPPPPSSHLQAHGAAGGHPGRSAPHCPPRARAQWCKVSFRDKEKRLHAFYESGDAPLGPAAECPVGEVEIRSRWLHAAAFWGVSCFVSWWSLVLVVGWLWVLAAVGAWVMVTRLGGVDALELRLHGRCAPPASTASHGALLLRPSGMRGGCPRGAAPVVPWGASPRPPCAAPCMLQGSPSPAPLPRARLRAFDAPVPPRRGGMYKGGMLRALHAD